ncbi:MAG: hypothetical protein DWQ07_04240 [Chloroflexi bacterium]|nr:MAG: hypothetical protein DWQ07_04240 [Chloroflexota bacterium]MBL1194642.1 hypothetical protein [Chloroflexota bacterium]NOH11932.1 hypothetical protein [Chloroflexota bacterium]
MNKDIRYTIRFLLTMLVYAVLLVAVAYLVREYPKMPMRFALILVPLIPGIYATWLVSQQVTSGDELQQRIQLESFGLAFAGTALVALTVGLLDYVGVEQLNGAWYVSIMLFLWGLGQLIANRKYT